MSTSAELPTKISTLQPGDHLCCIYETDEEHRALLTPCLRQGLERNEKVVYIVDARTAETVLGYLREDGLDPQPYLDRGQLAILTVSDAYMREGAFLPDRMISFLRQETDRAVGEGYVALRITGEMSWALRRLPGSNLLMEYESKLNSFLPGSRCLALCQYDKRRFPPEILLQVLATHPIAVIGTETFENVHYVSPEVFLTQDFPTAILGHWIEGLRIRRMVKAGEDALRESEGRFRAIFENSMDGILVTVPDGGILAANSAACEMLGRTEEEVCKIGRTGVVDLSAPRLPVLLEERDRTGMCHGELTFVRGDGTKFPGEISSGVFKDRRGNLLTSMVFRDITGRKKAEEILGDSVREIAESQRVAHIGSWDWDAAADSIRWSDEYYRIYSIDPKLPTPNYIDHLKVYTPESRERLDAAVKRVMQTGETYELDLELADPAGPTRWIYARGEAKRDSRGRVCGLRGTALDITERRQAEQVLRESEERARLQLSEIEAIYDSAGVGLCFIDANGRFVRINGRFAELNGVPAAAHSGRTIGEVAPDLAEQGEALLKHILETGRPVFGIEISGMTSARPGVRRTWLEHWTPMKDPDGRVLGVSIVAEDITDRKRAQEVLQRSVAYNRSLIEASLDPLVTIDAAGKITDVNSATEKVTGYPREVLVETEFSEYFTDPEKARAGYQRVFREGAVHGYPLEIRHRDGSVTPVLYNASVYRDESGKVLGVFAVARDISEQKQAHAALQQSEEELQTILHTATDGFWVTDRKGQFLEVNDAVCRNLGYSREELLRMSVSDIEAVEKPEEILQGVQRIVESGSDQFEGLHRCKDGSLRNVEISVNYLPPPHDRFFAFLRDITERKRAEEEKAKLEGQLQQAMKMEAVGRLAGGVAHDFNNLLTVITGYSELLLQQVGKESPMRREVDEIQRAADRAASLTQQLLAFSRKQIIEPRVVRLDLLVADMQAMLTRLIGEDIALQATIGKGLGSVKIDPGQFQQILMNLVVNSRDAMPDGGKIVIETANVDLDEGYCALHLHVKPGRYVMLSVSDTGQGISEEVKAHIFEPFFTTKERGSGTGLGLATTYGAVKQSGGSVEVYSEVGIGTTIKIYLPRVEEEAVKPVKDDRPTDLLGGTETVLLVEDEDTVRNLCTRILGDLGYKVMQARNGAEAVAAAAGHGERIDLLLTDVVMPGMNGRELATQLVLHHPEMKVLFTSGYTDDAIVHHGVLDEGVSFIGKPYTPSALTRKVREVLDRA